MTPEGPSTRTAAKNGMLLVISAPSGAGKHTILNQVLRNDANLEYSVSATTRPPREHEVNGRDYFFLDAAAFRRRVDAGEFAECAEVHGHLYGTLREELAKRLASGKDVVLEVDVQGMRNIKSLYPNAVTVFIVPPSLDELEQRLRIRGANDEDDIARRLHNARGEMAQCRTYDYVVVNDRLEEAIADTQAIIRAERCRAGRHTSGCAEVE